MADVHAIKFDPAVVRLDRLSILLEEQFRAGVDLGPRGVQMAALSLGIKQGAAEALAQLEQASTSLSPDNPAHQQLREVVEPLRQLILNLRAQARSLSGTTRQQSEADAVQGGHKGLVANPASGRRKASVVPLSRSVRGEKFEAVGEQLAQLAHSARA